MSVIHNEPAAIIAPAVDEFVAAINELEAQADAAETQPSDIRWEQARHVAAALDAGMTTRQLAAEWRKSDGSTYAKTHVIYTAGSWRAFGHYSDQDRPLFYAAYNSPEVRGKSAEPKDAHVANNSGENEWYTPSDYIEAARKALGGIDLDPASSALAQETVKAGQFFTKDTDGLKQAWHGNVWMNPPYAQPLVGQFVDKLCTAYGDGDVQAAIVLVNNATETAWGQQLLESATAAVFPKARIRFLDPQGNPGAPLQGQMFVYLGGHHIDFAREFARYGVVLRG
jgi:phage N-6-adenine-methyltransferase